MFELHSRAMYHDKWEIKMHDVVFPSDFHFCETINDSTYFGLEIKIGEIIN